MLDSRASENVCGAGHFLHNGLTSSRPRIFRDIQEGVRLDHLGARKAQVTHGSGKRGENNFEAMNARSS